MSSGIWKGKFSEETASYVSLYVYQKSTRNYYYIETPQYNFELAKTLIDESTGPMLVIAPEPLAFWSKEDESA